MLGSLVYPSMVDSQLQFGTNPYDIIHDQTFQYTFYGNSTKKFSYYTMAVYQQNWGLTGQLKSEYELRIGQKTVTKAEAEAAITQAASGASATQDGVKITWGGTNRAATASALSSVENLVRKNIDSKAEFIQ